MASLTSLIKQKQFYGIRKYLSVAKNPKVIVCTPGKVGQIVFQDGSKCNSSCLGCIERPCMKYSDNDFVLASQKIDFPIDKDNAVCPTHAIYWNDEDNCPIINHSQCIKCGLCIDRCPVKAIYVSQEVEIESAPNDYLISSCDVKDEKCIERTLACLSGIPTIGCIQNDSDSTVIEVYKRIFALKNVDQQFPNRFSRNLLMALGVRAYMRRNGEVYSRTDLVFENGNYQGVCEVEFSDLLDTPRDILDDMAVFIARYDISRENIVPLVIGLSLPNGRSEFWEVISDIQKVLNIKIYTMTIGALMLILWSLKKINILQEQFPYADSENCSIRPGLNKLLGHDTKLSIACLNILEPIKSSR